MSVISAFGGAARAFFAGSIAVDRFPDRIECAARWVFEAWAIYRDEQEENVEVQTNGPTCLRTPPFASQ
jgi:hypothetical protein